MGRWGEDEKKSKGLIGCAIAGLIMITTAYTFYVNYQNLEGRRQLEKKMQNIIRKGYKKSENQMVGEIVSAAEDLDLVLETKDINLEKVRDENGNYVVNARIEFNFDVNLLVTTWNVNIPIVEKVTLIL